MPLAFGSAPLRNKSLNASVGLAAASLSGWRKTIEPSVRPAIRVAATSRAVFFGPNIGSPFLSIAKFFEEDFLQGGGGFGGGVGVGEGQLEKSDFLILAADLLDGVHRG